MSHLSEMFTAVADGNGEILEQDAQRRAPVEELATMPRKGTDYRARHKVMKTAIGAMPPFRRVTGAAARLRVSSPRRTRSRAQPKALVRADTRVAKREQTGWKPSPVMVWTPDQTGAFLDFVAGGRPHAMWHLIAFRGLRLVAASGLPPIRMHDLRQGAATLMLAAGIDMKIVSDPLGHSDTGITRDTYQSVLPQVGKNAAEATAKLLPLQRKTEAEEAARKAAKNKQRAGQLRSRKPHRTPVG